MSTVRLTFLYPHLFRSTGICEPATRAAAATARSCRPSTSCRTRKQRNPPALRPFTTTTRSKEAVFERHGKAVEPLPEPQEITKLPQPKQTASNSSASDKAAASATKESDQPKKQKKKKNGNGSGNGNGNSARNAEAQKDADAPEQRADPAQKNAGSPTGSASQQQHKSSTEAIIQREGPMEAVLHMPPPEGQSTAPPHISTPPYVHHFDSWTLVKQLEEGGYTQGQAITSMKAVRGLLRQNLDVAQEGLVSKSDVDNETYLFNAACSELSAEVTNNHRVADEQTRQQRTVLQHEADMLSQRMSQDLATLRDDVKAMFHDRKMSVREEQRTMDSAVSPSQRNPGVNPVPLTRPADPADQPQDQRAAEQRRQVGH